MNLRLKTTLDVEAKLIELQTGLQFSTKAAVMRLAMGYSLRIPSDPTLQNLITGHYNIKNQNGQEYMRFTILLGDDAMYKMLFEQHLQKSLSEEEFFPRMIYSHIERGISLLYSEYKYAKRKDKLFADLLLKSKVNKL